MSDDQEPAGGVDVVVAGRGGTRTTVTLSRTWIVLAAVLLVTVIAAGSLAAVTYVRATQRLQAYSRLLIEVETLRRQNQALANLEHELRTLRDQQERMLELAGIKPALGFPSDLDGSLGADLVWPMEGSVDQDFSPPDRPWVGILAQPQQTVAAAGDGEVASVTETDSLGIRLVLTHDDRLQTAYSGLQLNLVSAGDRVDAGQVIALVGAVGGGDTMLRFEVLLEGERVNPRDYVRELFPADP